jgi:hypothetical protein
MPSARCAGLPAFSTVPCAGSKAPAPPFIEAKRMSGRSGYRKTDRKRNRFAKSQRVPKSDYVAALCRLPQLLAPFFHQANSATASRSASTISCSAPGRTRRIAASLPLTFSTRSARGNIRKQSAAQLVKLLPCSAHTMPQPPPSPGFRQIGTVIDLEAIHDRVSRFKAPGAALRDRRRRRRHQLSGGEGWRGVVHDYAAAAIASALDEIASRARCLPPPSHRRPDAFHEARSELAKEIANIAKWLRTGKGPV